MATFQCAGCKKVWSAEEPPSECGCGCRIVREVSVTPVEAKTPSGAGPELAPAMPAVASGPHPFWRQARVQGIAAVCSCLVLATAIWGGYAWHSVCEKRRVETEAYVFSSYQPYLDKAKALKAASLDRGEGFGPHLDALAAACSGAEAAWGAKNHELCRTFLEKTQVELQWLDVAVPGRAKVTALRLQVDGERSAAEREKAAEYAAAEWEAANAAVAKADGLREKGEFTPALTAYGDAASACRKAAAAARSAHITEAKTKFEGLFSPLAAKFELLEKESYQTGLVAAAEQDVTALERLAAEERGYLPEADGQRLAESTAHMGRCRARAAFGISLAEIETGLAALTQGRGTGQPALMESVRGKIDGALRNAGGVREDQAEADLKRLAAADGRLKGLEAAARAARVAELLAKAAEAKRNSDWRSVREKAEAALALDSGNAEALAFKQEVRDILTPTLRVTATADGGEVEATLSDGVSSYTTPALLTLERGRSYEYVLTYRSPSGARYRADALKITADWKGANSRQVALEPALITPATFEQALKESMEGAVLELGEGEFCVKTIELEKDLTICGRSSELTIIRVTKYNVDLRNGKYSFKNCTLLGAVDQSVVKTQNAVVELSGCAVRVNAATSSSASRSLWVDKKSKATLRDCQLEGIWVDEGSECTLASCSVSNPRSDGFTIRGKSLVQINSSVITRCESNALGISQESRVEIHNSKIIGNDSYGFYITDPDVHVYLADSEVSNNKSIGIAVYTGIIKLDRCKINNNGSNGIDLQRDGASCEYFNCEISGNRHSDISHPERAKQRSTPIQ